MISNQPRNSEKIIVLSIGHCCNVYSKHDCKGFVLINKLYRMHSRAYQIHATVMERGSDKYFLFRHSLSRPTMNIICWTRRLSPITALCLVQYQYPSLTSVLGYGEVGLYIARNHSYVSSNPACTEHILSEIQLIYILVSIHQSNLHYG